MLMRQMRQNTKIIMVLVAVAFVSLMIFEWGMDISGRSGGNDLGRVGGTAVPLLNYQNVYNSLYEQIQRSQAQPISMAQNREIEEMAWNEVVNQILIANELERRGIRVSDQEIQEAAQFSPPPQFQSDPAFQNEFGQFDLLRYREYLAQAGQDPAFLQQLEQFYRESIPREKLARQIMAGIYVSDAELWERWRETRDSVVVTALLVDPSLAIADGAVTVTPAEVQSHYRENRESFALPARARVRYTVLDARPSASDSVAALERAVTVQQEILAGADFAEVARTQSDDLGTAEVGGEMGNWGRGELVENIEEVAFALPVGEVSAPVTTSFGHHLLQVTAREDERVTLRHILIEIARTDDSEVELLMRADSLESLGTARSLDEAAAAFGLQVLTGEITESSAFLAGVGEALDGQDWIFFEQEEGAGTVSPLFEGPDAFYMLEILGMAPAETPAAEEVAPQIEATLRAERKRALASEETGRWLAELRSGSTTLEVVATRPGATLLQEGPFTRLDLVPRLGYQTAAIGAAFGAPVGEFIGPVNAADGIALLRIESRSEADRMAWEGQKELQRLQVTSTIQQTRLASWVEGLRETTRIVDNREAYFRAAEEAAERSPFQLY